MHTEKRMHADEAGSRDNYDPHAMDALVGQTAGAEEVDGEEIDIVDLVASMQRARVCDAITSMSRALESFAFASGVVARLIDEALINPED